VNCTSYYNTVFFPSDGVGYAANTCIIKTTNGGNSWSPVLTDTQGSHLRSIYFCNENTGFAVGEVSGHGMIYRTTNGGNNWDTQNTSNKLYDVSFINCSTGFIACQNGYILKTTTGGTTGIENTSNEVPEKFELYQNYPNPFNPLTKISFDIPIKSYTKIVVYDVTGREVTTLVNEELQTGKYEVTFNAANLASGVYLYTVTAGDFIAVKKMVLLK